MEKKLLGLIVIFGLSAILFTSCQKEDNINLSGTKWSASISNGADHVWSTLYFENTSYVIFTFGLNDNFDEMTFNYEISENIITIETGDWFGDLTPIFEKIGNHIYWVNYGDNLVLKYIQQ